MHDATTHANWEGQLLSLHLKNGAPTAAGLVTARLIALRGASKIVKKTRPRSQAQRKGTEDSKALNERIYGENPGKNAEGEWTIEASDFLRKEPKMLLAYLSMLKHTEKVMGKADYLISPCVFVCPFYNESKCNHGQFRLNGPGAVSQLYSHWQHAHKGNPAAATLEKRWRAALKNKMIAQQALDSGDTALDLATADLGDDKLRCPPASPADAFPHTFEARSAEYYEWLQAVGTL